MKISSSAISALAILAASAPRVQSQECLAGPFILEFSGTCNRSTLLAAYQDQVYRATGAVDSSACASSAEQDLDAKFENAGLTIDQFCKTVYNSAEEVPFHEASKKNGADLRFEGHFFNGRTVWQEEVETLYETDDRSATSILKEDAEAVRAFYDAIAQGTKVAWPGALPNFQSDVLDANDLETCTTNAAMCCWPKDRQANDNNGNCAKAYDVNCVDKDPADNTDLCFVDTSRGNMSNDFDSADGTILFPGDNNNGEGAIHCHGLAWSNDVTDATARYKGNNLFYVSMYDHMYQRGYVENVPGAPMCGCVEQMPTVSRSDCTQVDLTEKIKVVYDSTTNTFSGKVISVDVDFNACQGINNRNNDLWAYIARLYYQGDISAEQFGRAGRIITDDGCSEAVAYHLNSKSLTLGYSHDESQWTNVAGRETLKLHDGYGNKAFAKSLTDLGASEQAPYGILKRACASCVESHQHIYYRRLTPIPDGFDLMTNLLYRNDNGDGKHLWNVHFSLHSTYEDALAGTNPWKCPNNSYNYGAGFGGECSPTGDRVTNQGGRFDWSWRTDVGFYASKPEGSGLVPVDTTVIKGGDRAGGMALVDDEGTIYMTGAGRDIWDTHDDFNFYSEEASGDHTIITKVSSFTAPRPNYWAKAGIMIRRDMDPSSPHVMVLLAGTPGVCVLARFGTRNGNPNDKRSDSFGCHGAQGVTSAWLKLEKRINTYTSFMGTDNGSGNISWTQIARFDVPMIGDNYNMGLAVCSKEWLPAEAVFENYETDAYYYPSAAPSISSAPTVYVPSIDIGPVGIAGSSITSNAGSWVVSGAGADIWNNFDGFHFVNFQQTGDVDISVLVESFEASYSWAKAGLMIRDNLESNSMHYSMFLSGSNGMANQYRDCNGCWSGHSQTEYSRPTSVWLRITKFGNTVQAYFKHIGQESWTTFGAQRTMNFSSRTVWVGLAVCSHDTKKLATLKASNLEIFSPTMARNLRG